jgi:hypothetical protein
MDLIEGFDYPKISVWITSTGRYDLVKLDIESFVKYNTYPNFEWIIFESVPTEESLKYYNTPLLQSDKTIEYLKTVPNVQKLMIEPWPYWGDAAQALLDATDTDYFINLEDDWETICDPHEWFVDAIKLLRKKDDLYGLTGNLQRPTFNESWPGWTHPKYGKGIFKDDEHHYAYGMLVSMGGMLSKTAVVREVGGFPISSEGKHVSMGNMLIPGNPEGLFGDRVLFAGYGGGRLLNYYGWFCTRNIMSVGGADPRAPELVRIHSNMIEEGKVGKIKG